MSPEYCENFQLFTRVVDILTNFGFYIDTQMATVKNQSMTLPVSKVNNTVHLLKKY